MWAVSTRVAFGYQTRGNAAFGIRKGNVVWYDKFWFSYSKRTGWVAETQPFTLGMSFTLGEAYHPETEFARVAIPLWMPFTLAAIPTAILWHRDRRTVKPGCCRVCGYDLRASKRVCPECGNAIAPGPR